MGPMRIAGIDIGTDSVAMLGGEGRCEGWVLEKER